MRRLTSLLSILVGIFSLVAADIGHALTLDSFTPDHPQTISLVPGQMAVSAQAASTVIGGHRKLEALKSGGPLRVTAETVSGFYSHSQDAGVTGQTRVVWDGTSNNASLNTAGLGGIDFLQDSATGFRLKSLYADHDINLTITVWDAANPNNFSVRTISFLQNQVIPPVLDVPFNSFLAPLGGAGADFKNVGAVSMLITGSQDLDASLAWIGTNGICEDDLDLPNSNGQVIDPCGVCITDNPSLDGSSCWDCTQVPNGPALPGTACDPGQSGLCDTGTWTAIQNQPLLCQCIPTCKDCAGTINGSAVVDSCGVCGGDGTACCNTFDKGDISRVLDGLAKAQEALLKSIYKKIERSTLDTKILARTKSLRAQAHTLQLRNWVLSWTLPRITTSCTNKIFCYTISNKAVLDEYRAHSAQLRNMMTSARTLLKRVTKSKRSVAMTLQVRAQSLHDESLALAATVPEIETACTK